AGALFYTVFSLLLHTIRPYREAQRALGECIREIASYLSIRADFYNLETDLDENYKKVVAQQIVVNDKQDAARELFFKTRQIVQESTSDGRRLVFTFVETVDLFEEITASYYDHALLRQQFAHTGALEIIYHSLKKIAFELDSIGISIQGNSSFRKTFDYDEEVRYLKSQIDRIAPKGEAQTLVLRKILVNIRKMLTELNNINQYFEGDIKAQGSTLDHSHFVSHQPLDPKIFWNNLSLESSAFRHALRVCIASLAGFIIVNLISYGHHSYWVLMTIAFMLKPAFSLTKQRNIQRIIGTFAGGLIGVLILVLIPNKTVHFVFMVLLMIGTYSFMRIRYLWMVICTTPYVLLLFSFLGSNYKTVVEERVFDTVLGCAIAFTAGYFLFPNWESNQLKEYMQGMLKANAAYLQKIIDALSGKKPSLLEYKLARKDVYLNSANLSAAFQRMLSEPKSKQRGEKDIHQFVVLNHILFSNIATVATTLLSKEVRVHPAELIHIAKKARVSLCESTKKLGGEDIVKTFGEHPVSIEPVLGSDDVLLREQLIFISKVSSDIDKTTKTLTGL
ncbi:MAG: FUSC family membrane protein, partial [Flavisolibacter sp.]